MSALRRAGLWGALAGSTLLGGGCSLKAIGAGLLSEYLTSRGGDALGTDVTSDLVSLLGQLTGAA